MGAIKMTIPRGTVTGIYPVTIETTTRLPMTPFGISAGFPSPALDFIDLSIDLNKYLIAHPSATYCGRVQGESMKDAGINDGDLLIIDKSLQPADGKIAVCYLDGDFTLKRISVNKTGLWLVPENEKYKPIKIEEHNNFTIWGIVTYVIKRPL